MPKSIKQIQVGILEKLELKKEFKGGVTKQKLAKYFSEFDKDNDGFLTAADFSMACPVTMVAKDEAEFLFMFWDTMAGEQEGQGAIEVGLIAVDLLQCMPEYGTGFRSGDDGFKMKGAKGNQPSQAGGIFGGGAYEADTPR